MVEWCPKCNAMLSPGVEECPRCGEPVGEKAPLINTKDIANITLYIVGIALIPMVAIILISLICVNIGNIPFQ